jgi:hypothetical protein
MEGRCSKEINTFLKKYILKENHVANLHVWEPLA